jgi:hypothetical protein
MNNRFFQLPKMNRACFGRKARIISGFFAFFLVLVSCSGEGLGISPDLLRSSPFAVTKWSPGGGYHAEPSALLVSLDFSHTPDRASVERHFSITGDGNHIGGAFQWNGKKMTFIPSTPLEANRDYVLSLAADAHDEDGLSMDKAFDARFTTRPDNIRPVLVSVFPEMNVVVSDLYTVIRLVFSQAVSLNSLRDCVSFDPSINGSWRLENDCREAVFTPAEPWSYGKRYEVRVSADLAGNAGMTMGKDFSSVFVIGMDIEIPRLIEAWRVTKTGPDERLMEGKFIENSGWEKDDRLRLVFSEPVDVLSVKNCLSADGAPSFSMETFPALSDEALFCFESFPAYESRFIFKLKTGVRDSAGNESADEYTFKVFADGGQSKPPELAGVRIPMVPDSSTDKELKSYRTDSLFEGLPVNGASVLGNGTGAYPYNVQTDTWIECYFETAPGKSIDIISLMALFRVETSNNVLVFSPTLIKQNYFSVTDPETGWEKYQRIEIAGSLTNTVNSGVVNIQIDSGLKDSSGNRSEKAFRVSLVK